MDLNAYKWAAITMEPQTDMKRADSLNLRALRRTQNVHRWKLELTSRLEPQHLARRLAAMVNFAQMGGLWFIHPTRGYTSGVEPAGGLSLVGAHEAGSQRITVTGDHPWQLRGGDLINLSRTSKVFEVAQDTALKAGNQTVWLTSPLRWPLADIGGRVTVNGVMLRLIPDGMIATEEEGVNGPLVELTIVLLEQL